MVRMMKLLVNAKLIPKASQLFLLTSIALIALLFLGGCKKSEERSYPHKYKFKSLGVGGPTQVFANGVEITDEKVKKDFVDTLVYFFFDKNTKDESLELSLVSDSTAFFFSTEPYYYEKTGNRFIFTHSRKGLVDVDYPFRNYLHLWKYQREPQIAPKGYYIYSTFVGYGDRWSLVLPYTAYKVVHTIRVDGKVGVRSMKAGAAYREFNEDAIKNMREGDTLAVRRYMVYLSAN